MQALIASMGSSYDFVFAQAPESGGLWIPDPPGGKDSPTTDPNFAAASVSYLDGLRQSQGPFFAILGCNRRAT